MWPCLRGFKPPPISKISAQRYNSFSHVSDYWTHSRCSRSERALQTRWTQSVPQGYEQMEICSFVSSLFRLLCTNLVEKMHWFSLTIVRCSWFVQKLGKSWVRFQQKAPTRISSICHQFPLAEETRSRRCCWILIRAALTYGVYIPWIASKLIFSSFHSKVNWASCE